MNAWSSIDSWRRIKVPSLLRAPGAHLFLSAELSSLTEECVQLRQRTARTESDMAGVREDNCRMESENRQLHDSLDELSRLKEWLQTNESTWRDQVGSVKSEAGIVRNQVIESLYCKKLGVQTGGVVYLALQHINQCLGLGFRV